VKPNFFRFKSDSYFSFRVLAGGNSWKLQRCQVPLFLLLLLLSFFYFEIIADIQLGWSQDNQLFVIGAGDFLDLIF
jgi:hypothetical protein